MSSTEEWRPVVGREDEYHVSDQGRVKSFVRGAPRLLKPGGRYPCYPSVVLGRGNTRSVHALVAEAFLGPRPKGQEIRHLDGDRSNPRLANLAYGPRSENNFDRVQHQRYKFTTEQVAKVKALKGKTTAPAIMDAFGMSRAHVYDIWHNRKRTRG